MSGPVKRPMVLAVASGGGHWIQLLRLRAAFGEVDVVYATTNPDHREVVGTARFCLVPEANRWESMRLVRCALVMLRTLLVVRPDVVITTGAAPGYLAVRLARLLRMRTVWVDSIANADELSLSGQRAGRFVDLWITQWEHLVGESGPEYFGTVLGEVTDATDGRVQHDASHPRVAQDVRPRRIFVTVGTELPFDRLVGAIDRWAGCRGADVEVFAQTGDGEYRPENIEWEPFVDRATFTRRFGEADLVVAHAGMGTILSALEDGKPLLVMPRRADLREHRNDHQLATASRLSALDREAVAADETALVASLDAATADAPSKRIGPDADAALIAELSDFIAQPDRAND